MILPMNEKITKFYKAIGQRLVNLSERWQDEKGYEDIKEYQKVLQTEAMKFGITLTGMTSRPFGCVFVDGGNKYTLQAKLKPNGASVVLSWVKA